MISSPPALSGLQPLLLIVLRTLIGWHFLYEGYFKLLHPAWSRATGAPLEPFSATGYLQNASGPLAPLLHAMARPEWAGWVNGGVALALLVAGVLLMLGLFTQLGCAIAAGLLATFYVSAIPWSGIPEPRAEGTYLIVNKNLIELAAVLVVMSFRTGRIAGLDTLRRRRPRASAHPHEATA
jgi:thiosulfate dehydrogenase [quinone] large subunit